MKPMTIDARETLRANLTIRVRMPLAFGLRNWLVVKLFQLAGAISAVPVEIELQERAGYDSLGDR